MISTCSQYKTIVNEIFYRHFFSYKALPTGVYFTLATHLHVDISSAR